MATTALVLFSPLMLVAVVSAALRRRTLLHMEHICGCGGEVIRLPLLTSKVSRRLPIRGLPAFEAVLAGKLSIVGPQPHRCDEAYPPLALQLTAIKPAVTGPWRLREADASAEQQAIADLAYACNYSVWEDVRIVGESLRRSRIREGRFALARWQLAAQAPTDRGLLQAERS